LSPIRFLFPPPVEIRRFVRWLSEAVVASSLHPVDRIVASGCRGSTASEGHRKFLQLLTDRGSSGGPVSSQTVLRQMAAEPLGYLSDISRSHGDQYVVGAQMGLQMPDDFPVAMYIRHIGAAEPNPLGQVTRRHTTTAEGSLARTENLCHQNLVGIVQGRGQFVQ